MWPFFSFAWQSLPAVWRIINQKWLGVTMRQDWKSGSTRSDLESIYVTDLAWQSTSSIGILHGCCGILTLFASHVSPCPTEIGRFWSLSNSSCKKVQCDTAVDCHWIAIVLYRFHCSIKPHSSASYLLVCWQGIEGKNISDLTIGEAECQRTARWPWWKRWALR